MAKWCFKNYIELLDSCKKNKSGITKTQVVMDLLDFIAINHIEQKRCSDFKRITEESRARKFYGENPTPIPNRYYQAVSHIDFNENELLLNFKEFIKNFELFNLSNRLATLIQSDIFLSERDKKELLSKNNNKDKEFFLLLLFVDIIKYRGNEIIDGNNDDDDIDFFDLDERIENSSDNEKILTLFQEALEISNDVLVEKSLSKMTNHVYITQGLEYLCCLESFINKENYQIMFHKKTSDMTNNLYRMRLMTSCLSEGYFNSHSDELFFHLKEFTNNRYLFETLVFMWKEMNLKQEVKFYQSLLTSDKYSKILGEIINKNN